MNNRFYPRYTIAQDKKIAIPEAYRNNLNKITIFTDLSFFIVLYVRFASNSTFFYFKKITNKIPLIHLLITPQNFHTRYFLSTMKALGDSFLFQLETGQRLSVTAA